MELVSAIIPAYNAGKYVRQAIDSVLAQTYPAVEVVVVDDGSTDETPRILADYGTRIRVVSQSNQGVAKACNAGVAAASGTWVAFLDADDSWLPDKVSSQLRRCSDTAISHTDSFCFGDGIDGEIRRSSFEPPYSGRVLPQLLVTNFITKSSVMMRRDVYLQQGGFDETLHGVEDWPFWLKVCAEHDLGYLADPVVRYRVHATSKSMQSRKTMVDHRRIIDWAFAPGGPGSAFPDLQRQALVSSYQINGHYAAESGDWRFALRCGLTALRYAPTSTRIWKNVVKSALIPLGVKY